MKVSDVQVWFITGVVAVIWAVLVVAAGFTGNLGTGLGWIQGVVPFVVLALLVFERRLWRVRRLHPRPIPTPVIWGTWRGELRSLWVNGQTGRPPAPKTVYMAIEQTLMTVDVRLMTDESFSHQIAGAVAKGSDGDWILSTTYQTIPKLQHREKSPISYGGLMARILGDGGIRLEAEYWTDRLSRGTINLRERRNRIVRSFEDAQRLFGDVPVGPDQAS